MEGSGEPCDVSLNPNGYYRDAELAGALGAEHEQMDHGSSAEEGTEEGTAGGEEGEEAPNDMSGGLGEVEASRLIVQLVEYDQPTYDQWLKSLNPERDVEAPDDTGAGGHLGPQTWTHTTDPEVCGQLAEQIETARQVALQYPKASDAMEAGYVLVAPYLPGIASHWMNFRLVDGTFEVTEPEMLLYDGNGPDANIVGLSYYIRQPGDEEPSIGFAGDNDHYHRHLGLCIGPTGVIGDTTTTDEECEALGGEKSSGAAGWMSHAWVVPGCESPWGLFSAQNPILDDDLVQASGQGEPCSGSAARDRWDLSPAED